MIFDTHSHYDDSAFDKDREALLTGLPSKGIGTVVSVGADIGSSKAALALAQTYEHVYAAVGVHPSETGDLKEQDLDWLRSQAQKKKVVAIGEIGLDYHWDEPAPDVQKIWFERQIELAKELKLPVIYHSREAASDTMEMIRKTNARECGGVIHCYSYSWEMAMEYVKMGFYIGIGGVVTFKNARKLKEVVRKVPMEHLVLETDCPYLAPEPHRGKRNDSSLLDYVVEEVAALKQIEREKVIEITEKNAKQLYRI